jgi:hypothetical protein
MTTSSEPVSTVPVLSLQAQLARDLESIRRVAAKVESMLATAHNADQAQSLRGTP